MKEKIPISKTEYEILMKIAEKNFKEGTIEEAEQILGVSKSTLESIFRLLADKDLVRINEIIEDIPVLTEKGEEALVEGLPEEQLITLIESGEKELAKVKSKLGKIAGIAIGQAIKKGYIKIIDNKVELITPPEKVREDIQKIKLYLKRVKEGKIKHVDKTLLKRGLIKLEKTRHLKITLVDEPQKILENVQIEVSALTRDLIKTGKWRTVSLKTYDITAQPPRILPARKHFLMEFIEMLRDILKEMGFKEVEGPIIEYELYNFDLLFQPQDHPAREIHDTLWIQNGVKELNLPEELEKKIAEIHKRGWNYEWSRKITERLVLRSQTTAVSARILVSKPKPPLRVFTLGRVYRSDVVDATHLPEFHQLDGLDGDYNYTFRDLLGVLQEISERLGFQIKFKPGYFPFTEPSVEGYVRLPNGRWLELFGAGLMRPEVLEMAGIDYPVGAWGFGVERLAAAYYGIPDIRILYTKDVTTIRSMKLKLL